ncbi:hypothetical protein ACHAW5_003033 [Stephanodiscus triporus]|uniref:Uncharacterized protein n=1 Tax=Stephanodiscus triporus TaxID=2934178 RepID=A0ABD3NRC5_9STRA
MRRILAPSTFPRIVSAIILQVLGAMAWFWMIAPVVQSAWILSKGFKRDGGHMLLAARHDQLLSCLLVAGMTNASLWLAKDFNLNDWDDGDVMGTGWRSLALGIVGVIFYSIETETEIRRDDEAPWHRWRSSSSPIIIVENDEDGRRCRRNDAESASGTTSRVRVEPTFSQMDCSSAFWHCWTSSPTSCVSWTGDIRTNVPGDEPHPRGDLPPDGLLCSRENSPPATERYEREEGRVRSFLADDERAAYVVGNDESGAALLPPPTPPPDHMMWPRGVRSSEDEGGMIIS